MPASPRRQSTVRSAYEFFAQRLKRRRKKFAWKKEMRGKFRREIPFSSVLGKKIQIYGKLLKCGASARFRHKIRQTKRVTGALSIRLGASR